MILFERHNDTKASMNIGRINKALKVKNVWIRPGNTSALLNKTPSIKSIRHRLNRIINTKNPASHGQLNELLIAVDDAEMYNIRKYSGKRLLFAGKLYDIPILEEESNQYPDYSSKIFFS